MHGWVGRQTDRQTDRQRERERERERETKRQTDRKTDSCHTPPHTRTYARRHARRHRCVRDREREANTFIQKFTYALTITKKSRTYTTTHLQAFTDRAGRNSSHCQNILKLFMSTSYQFTPETYCKHSNNKPVSITDTMKSLYNSR